MEYASLYVTNVQCEMCDAKDLQIFSIATVKATVTPDIEVICPCLWGADVCSCSAECMHIWILHLAHSRMIFTVLGSVPLYPVLLSLIPQITSNNPLLSPYATR